MEDDAMLFVSGQPTELESFELTQTADYRRIRPVSSTWAAGGWPGTVVRVDVHGRDGIRMYWIGLKEDPCHWVAPRSAAWPTLDFVSYCMLETDISFEYHRAQFRAGELVSGRPARQPPRNWRSRWPREMGIDPGSLLPGRTIVREPG